MAKRERKREGPKKPEPAEPSLASVVVDLKGLERLHQLEWELIWAIIRQVEQLTEE